MKESKDVTHMKSREKSGRTENIRKKLWKHPTGHCQSIKAQREKLKNELKHCGVVILIFKKDLWMNQMSKAHRVTGLVKLPLSYWLVLSSSAHTDKYQYNRPKYYLHN